VPRTRSGTYEGNNAKDIMREGFGKKEKTNSMCPFKERRRGRKRRGNAKRGKTSTTTPGMREESKQQGRGKERATSMEVWQGEHGDGGSKD